VTVSNSELGTSEFETVTLTRPEPSDVPESENSELPEVAERDIWRERGLAFVAYFTPPSVLKEPPASVEDLADYAHRAGYTKHPRISVTVDPLTGQKTERRHWVREAGIWWHRLIGIPVTAVCRYVEWIAQRPGRAVPVLLLVKLLAQTSYGSWAITYLFAPVAHAAAWVLL